MDEYEEEALERQKAADIEELRHKIKMMSIEVAEFAQAYHSVLSEVDDLELELERLL